MSYPLTADAGGIKVKPERMERERLYHCVAGDKVMLVYKDNQDVLHCYEVEERELVERVRNCADRGMVDGILAGYAAEIGGGDGAHINKSAGHVGAEEPLSSKKQTDAEEILSEFKAAGSPGDEQGGSGQEAQGCGAGCAGSAGGPQEQDGRPAAEEPAVFLDGGDLTFMPPDSEQQGAAAAEAAGTGQAAAAEPGTGTEQAGEAAATAEPEPTAQEGPQAGSEAQPQEVQGADDAKPERNNVVFIGQKSTMDYVQATLTRLSNYHFVTITARGKRITLAVDVSQMIVKRMNKVGYEISEVRIGSDTMESEDGKIRNVSTIEIDIVDGMEPGQGGAEKAAD